MPAFVIRILPASTTQKSMGSVVFVLIINSFFILLSTYAEAAGDATSCSDRSDEG